MRNEQKNSIFDMRSEGMGYGEIASTLNIPIETVRGYCRRNRLNDIGEVAKLNALVLQEKNEVCTECKIPIKQKSKGRVRKFCSEECRRKWWNENTDKKNKRPSAIYEITCAECGEVFESYGNPNKKYCCHACYIKSRFMKGCEI